MKLVHEIERLHRLMPPDFFGGGCPLEKSYLMCQLAKTLHAKTYVELGVYRARSFFPPALVMQGCGGKAYGVDPYTKDDALEKDLAPEVKDCLDTVISNMDFEEVLGGVRKTIQDLGLEDTVELLRMPSAQAAAYFRDAGIAIDMLHIDGNHDTRFVMQDVELYAPLVAAGGIVVMDDTNWNSVRPAYDWMLERMTLLFETREFAVFMNRQDGDELEVLKQALSLFHEILTSKTSLSAAIQHPVAHGTGSSTGATTPPASPVVSVCVITYNQEKYISQAINSVLAQQTNFPFEVVIADDCSTDDTATLCKHYQEQRPDLIRLLHRTSNLGAVPNYLETFKACKGKYVAFLEGDDYWIDPQKLQKQVDFLEANPDFAICCHNVYAVDEHGEVTRPLLFEAPKVSTVENLCKGPDYISTPSCMVRNGLLEEIPPWMYSLPGCDWVLDILNAEHGKIRYFPEVMAAYRIHPDSVWSSKKPEEKLRTALNLVQTIDEKLDYRFTRFFQSYEQTLKYQLRIITGAHPPPDMLAMLASGGVESQTALAYEYEVALMELDEVRGQIVRSKKEIRALQKAFGDLQKKHQTCCKVIQSAENWHKKPWFKRVFRRWKPPTKSILNSTSLNGRSAPANISTSATLKPAPLESPAGSPPVAENPAIATRVDLLVLDDTFPHPASAFRFQEFASYIESIPNTCVQSSGASFSCFKEARTLEEIIAVEVAKSPNLKGRIRRYEIKARLNAKVAYIVFLSNARRFLRKLEKESIPFVFTLYPGGGFALHCPDSDEILRAVLQSPCFRKVIVTQTITRDYLLEKGFCHPGQIEYIFGVVTPLSHMNWDLAKKQRYGRDKQTLDLCFVAHRYSPTGVDKGYDVFIEVARRLVSRNMKVNFHVVGGFDRHVLDVSDLDPHIHFYGMQEPGWFASFYRDKDIILSPNIPFKLGGGFFDGFPTGCCTDAALHGVAMFCTDLLHLNEHFIDGEDIVILPYNIDQITGKIEHYFDHPEKLASLGERGCGKVREIYGYEGQIAPRIRLLREIIQREGNDL